MAVKKQVGGTIKKSIGEYYASYVEHLLESGRYETTAEVLREALRCHEDRRSMSFDRGGFRNQNNEGDLVDNS